MCDCTCFSGYPLFKALTNFLELGCQGFIFGLIGEWIEESYYCIPAYGSPVWVLHIWLSVSRALLATESDPGEIAHGCLQEKQLNVLLEFASIYLFASPMHQCSKHTTVKAEIDQ